MRRVGKLLGGALLVLVAIIGGLYAFAPRDRVDLTRRFDPATLTPDLGGYLAQRESVFDDLTEGTEKRIIWARGVEEKTDYAVVYLHGFSATSEEIRPVPDRVAEALGANLFFTRLAGHGRGGDAMAEATAADWVYDLDEALAIGSRIGDTVIVIATSTGGTLAALAASDPARAAQIDGIVFVSPNFGLNRTAALILDMPLARYWAHLIVGETVGFQPKNAAQERFWTTRYPTTALFPMATLVRASRAIDFGTATIPALFLYAETDSVVSPDRTKAVAARWGGPSQNHALTLGPDDDAFSHVIAGDIVSPGQTEPTTRIILDWVRAQ